MTEPTRRVEVLAARLGLTEGQTYTVALLTLAALLLTSSLTGLTGRIADAVASPAIAGVVDVSTTTTTTVADGHTPLPPFGPSSPAVTSPPATLLPSEPFDPLEADAPPPADPCSAEAALDTARTALTKLDDLTGGIVPDGTIVSALALATGCSQADPGVLLLASLIEVGQSLPYLGLGGILLPTLPFLEIPAPVVALIQPARDVLDPICNTVATVNVITSQAGPAYQPPFDAVFSVSLFYALATCGQLQP